ncbi:MAG: hypothetical protein WA421_11405 [Nitrososphaeraceae archaeon]
MVRPLKSDRESVAITTVRVSPKTKQLLQDLQRRHDFKTIDSVLQFYLSEKAIVNQASFHTAREIRDLTKSNIVDADRLISRVSKDVAKRIDNVNKYSLYQSKSKIKKSTSSWQRQRRKSGVSLFVGC